MFRSASIFSIRRWAAGAISGPIIVFGSEGLCRIRTANRVLFEPSFGSFSASRVLFDFSFGSKGHLRVRTVQRAFSKHLSGPRKSTSTSAHLQVGPPFVSITDCQLPCIRFSCAMAQALGGSPHSLSFGYTASMAANTYAAMTNGRPLGITCGCRPFWMGGHLRWWWWEWLLQRWWWQWSGLLQCDTKVPRSIQQVSAV